ncbi:hypothetical protein PYCC9005_005165 [Savitreella phatthalungensis]
MFLFSSARKQVARDMMADRHRREAGGSRRSSRSNSAAAFTQSLDGYSDAFFNWDMQEQLRAAYYANAGDTERAALAKPSAEANPSTVPPNMQNPGQSHRPRQRAQPSFDAAAPGASKRRITDHGTIRQPGPPAETGSNMAAPPATAPGSVHTATANTQTDAGALNASGKSPRLPSSSTRLDGPALKRAGKMHKQAVLDAWVACQRCMVAQEHSTQSRLREDKLERVRRQQRAMTSNASTATATDSSTADFTAPRTPVGRQSEVSSSFGASASDPVARKSHNIIGWKGLLGKKSAPQKESTAPASIHTGAGDQTIESSTTFTYGIRFEDLPDERPKPLPSIDPDLSAAARGRDLQLDLEHLDRAFRRALQLQAPPSSASKSHRSRTQQQRQQQKHEKAGDPSSPSRKRLAHQASARGPSFAALEAAV